MGSISKSSVNSFPRGIKTYEIFSLEQIFPSASIFFVSSFLCFNYVLAGGDKSCGFYSGVNDFSLKL